MAALPYMPLYIADYMADAAHLSMEEHGAYLLLIMTYWQRGKPLQDDDERLARICRTDVERWLNVRSAVVEFFEIKDGELRHKRIDQELKKVEAKSKKAKIAGKLSGEARRQTSENIEKTNGRSTDAERTLNHTDTDTDTDTERKKEKGRARTLSDLELDDDLRSIAAENQRDPEREIIQFRDYCQSHGKPYKDYRAAFRTWLRNDFGKQSKPPPGGQRWAI